LEGYSAESLRFWQERAQEGTLVLKVTIGTTLQEGRLECDPRDLAWADEFAEALWDGVPLAQRRIYFMAEGARRAEQLSAGPVVAEAALARGVAYTPRLQCLLWDGMRQK